MALIFDLESDGFLEAVTQVHCLVLKDTETGIVTRYNNQGTEQSIERGLEFLMLTTGTIVEGTVVGHNVIGYDIPVLKKLYPWFSVTESRVLDTLVIARMIYPDTYALDERLIAKGKIEKHSFKPHALETWGVRLGVHKGDFKGPWEVWTQEMEDYCVQDVEVTAKLLDTLLTSKHYPEKPLASEIEHAVEWILQRQQRYGFLFNQEKAATLYSKLVKRKLELAEELKKAFKPWFANCGTKIPTVSAKRQVEELGEDHKAPIKKNKVVVGYKFKTVDYTEGVPYSKIALIQFNPGSRDHISDRLQKLFGWQPEEYTKEGKPKMDEAILLQLPYADAKPLIEYFVVDKRIGQLSEGKESWLKNVKADGRMHGGVVSCGAVTCRMAHSRPNMGQVPAGYSPYGHECRELFEVPEGKLLVGADADALELRDLAGYMAPYDDGAYVETVLKGNKALGTDMHSVNSRAIGLDPKAFYHGEESGRDVAKTWFYAFIYGAGDEKLGFIMTRTKGEKAKRAGTKSKKDFMKNLPALGTLIRKVKKVAKAKGFVRALDGRHIHVRSQHAALNTLLQSAGAIQMKLALVILDRSLQEKGLVPGEHYEFVANVHDEWQIESDSDQAVNVGESATEAIKRAGEQLAFRCPLAGQYKVGSNWADTH